jgi:hypothetical protein
MPERTSPPPPSDTPEPIYLPERKPTRRRLHVVVALCLFSAAISLPLGLYHLTQGELVAGLAFLASGSFMVWFALENRRRARQTPA